MFVIKTLGSNYYLSIAGYYTKDIKRIQIFKTLESAKKAKKANEFIVKIGDKNS